MKNFFALLTLFTLSVSAYAKDPILTCTIKNPKTKQVGTAQINLNKIDDNGAESEGIDSGKDHYSFYMTAEKVNTNYEIEVTFYESNNVQDEVGGTTCLYSEKKGSKVFCYEPLTSDNGWTVAIFYCQVK